MTKDMAITKLIQALQEAGYTCVHIPTSMIVVRLNEREKVTLTVGMVKWRKS